MYSFLLDDSSEHKKTKEVNKNVVATINHVLLNKKCLRHSVNRIQSKDRRQELIKSTKLLCLALMTRHISKTMNAMD